MLALSKCYTIPPRKLLHYLERKIRQPEGRLAAEKELSAKLEKAQKAAEAEAERLKKELKSSGNQDVALFNDRFQDVQKDFHAIIEALGRVGAGGDAGQHDKLVDALRTLMSALEQSIPEKLETRHG